MLFNLVYNVIMKEKYSIHALAYFKMLQTGSWIESQIKEALKPFNLTHAQLNVLHLLYENDPEPIAANELKRKMLVSNPDVTRLLDRLVKKGFVSRQTCPENRRKIDISITESGIEIYKKAHGEAKKSVHNFFKDKISENEAKELRRILQKMKD